MSKELTSLNRDSAGNTIEQFTDLVVSLQEVPLLLQLAIVITALTFLVKAIKKRGE